MNPNIWFKLLFYVLSGICFVILGWYPEHLRFDRYVAQQDGLVLAAKQKIKDQKGEHDIIVKGLQDELKTKTALLNSYYSVSLRSSSSSPLLSRSTTTTGIDAEAKYTLLAGQCADTTLKYELLQKYEEERMKLHDQ